MVKRKFRIRMSLRMNGHPLVIQHYPIIIVIVVIIIITIHYRLQDTSSRPGVFNRGPACPQVFSQHAIYFLTCRHDTRWMAAVGSMPVVGSSRNRTLGLADSSTATASRLSGSALTPPRREMTRRGAKGRSSMRSNT